MDDEGPSVANTANSRKFLSRAHWKGKLFTGNRPDDTSGAGPEGIAGGGAVNDDVMDFLRPAARKPSPSVPAQQLGRLDISKAQRWPSASDIRRSSTVPATAAHSRTPSRNRSASPVRNKKGYCVRFTDAAPEIIGEGGDDAEWPSRDVKRSRARSHSPPTRPQLGRYGSSNDTIPPALQLGYAHPPDVPSKGTNRSDDFASSPLPHSLAPTLPPHSLAPAKPSIASAQAKMRAEEGRALSMSIDDFSPPPSRGHPSHAPEAASDASRDEAQQATDFNAPAITPLIRPSSQTSDSSASSYSPPPQWSSAFSKYVAPTEADMRPSVPDKGPSMSEKAPAVPDKGSPRLLNASFQDAPTARPPLSPFRSDSSMADLDAFDTFISRVQHLSKIFQLSSEAGRRVGRPTLQEWVLAAHWWFLKGRAELEIAIRQRPTRSERGQPPSSPPQPPEQAFVDLAKSWWIVEEVLLAHPELTAYGTRDLAACISAAKLDGHDQVAALIEISQEVLGHLRMLATSMQKNGFLPPASGQILLAQGLDSSIWMTYPSFAPDVCRALSGKSSKQLIDLPSDAFMDPKEIMPIRDSDWRFNYGRIFADAFLYDEGHASQEYRMACVVSMTRERADRQIGMAIASQNGLVRVYVQSNWKRGPTWEEVQWNKRNGQVVVKLGRGFSLMLRFKERDFMKLWDFYDHTQQFLANVLPLHDEMVVLNDQVKVFHFLDAGGRAMPFPKEAVSQCIVQIFEKQITRSEGTGVRRLHRGYRMMVFTGPQTKILSSVSYELGKQHPLIYSILRGAGGDPALMLKIRDDRGRYSMVFSFQEAAARAQLLSTLNGTTAKSHESVVADVRLKSLSIRPHPPTETSSAPSRDVMSELGWDRVRIINRDPDDPDHRSAPTVLSESLRICLESRSGNATDRVNLGPGQLQFCLGADTSATIALLRAAQEDMTISVAETPRTDNVPDALNELLRTLKSSESVRTFSFPSMEDLHRFQEAVMGFSVLFDGYGSTRRNDALTANMWAFSRASTFAISRRMMLVSMHKKWECNLVRMQIVRQDRVWQLVVFFEDFSHGKCMNFQLKSTDFYESFTKSGKYMTRLVDAKFALPKGEESESQAFVCLDMPEYPSEHDDIHIAFDSEAGAQIPPHAYDHI
ncbi:MAG: hypothetical protein M1838_003879 [Thelocarpon superellum]|nr:MAG: hypothetical protein M1838_003879 [Thelocarpon superellum]